MLRDATHRGRWQRGPRGLRQQRETVREYYAGQAAGRHLAQPHAVGRGPISKRGSNGGWLHSLVLLATVTREVWRAAMDCMFATEC